MLAKYLMNHPLRQYQVWSHLGWRDVRVRYSETTLGPFWSTSALFTVVIGSSIAVSVLSGQALFENATGLALKLTLWTLIFNSINDSAELFLLERPLLLNSLIGEDVLVLRMVWRNFVYFLHNLIVVVVFYLIQSPLNAYRTLLMIPFGFITAALLVVPGFLLARIGARFRDLRVLVPSFLQLVFFASPILWVAPASGLGRLAADVNPVAWVLETGYGIGIRGVLLFNYAFHLAVLLFVFAVCFELLRTRAKSIRNIL